MKFKNTFSVPVLLTFCFLISACNKTEIKSPSPPLKKGESTSQITKNNSGLIKEKAGKKIVRSANYCPIEIGKDDKKILSFDNTPWCSRAYNEFGCSLFNEVFQSKSNTFISPISISLALAMTYNGAEGKTKEEMASVLNISGIDLSSFNKANEELINQLTPDNDSLKLSIANSLWAKENEPFKKTFLNIARKFYQAEIENVDFTNPKTVPRINNWVEKKTENKIKDLLAKNDVGRDTLLVLINAIYFKDKWQIPFKKYLTKMRDFYLLDGTTKKVSMMSNSDKYLYFEDSECQAIQLPYSDNRLRMVIFLPAKSGSLKNFLKRFSENDWEEYMKKFRMKNGNVLLPKFKMEFKVELKKILANLGMPSAFKNANFKKMLDSNARISKVIHQTFIEVDEVGTEAAAATAVVMARCIFTQPSRQPFKMTINRPFFFTIYDSRSKAILFMGTVVNP